MGNMGYCRFENTLGDLNDCFEALNNNEKLSESESDALKDMLNEILDFLEDNGIVSESNKSRIDSFVESVTEKDDDESEEED